jgi:copper homeostasis protein
MALLEIACFSADHALHAFNSGADRIELCDNREAGGTTPSFESLQYVKQNVNIPVFVMIRPRGGDFIYDRGEFEQMKADIDRFKSMADGCVLGILNADSTIDTARTRDLVQRAAPLPCTFHRAFDETLDLRSAFEDVVSTGCRAILSSGGALNAVSGAGVLRELVQSARGRIAIIPGGGVRARNLLELHGFTEAGVYHSSGLIAGRDDPDPNEIRRMKMLLREQPLAQLASIDPAQQQIPRGKSGPDEDGEKHPPVHVSAVSIGASTPVEQIDNRIP